MSEDKKKLEHDKQNSMADKESEDSGTVHVEWSSQVEDILAAEGEKCRGLSWIHMRCESEMSRFNTFVQVPVIVLSTLAGTASVGSSTLFGSGNATVSGIAIGMVSIAVGILNTLGGFFNFAKRAEAHRIAHLHYSKISSKIQIELSLPRLERDSAESLLNYVRDSMERLAETTPLASEKIISEFNKQFSTLKESIAMPPETNGLHKIVVYRSNGPIPTPKFSFDVDVPNFSQAGDTATFIAARAQNIVDQAAKDADKQKKQQLFHEIKQHSFKPFQTVLVPQSSTPKTNSRNTPRDTNARNTPKESVPNPPSGVEEIPVMVVENEDET
jgi:hypothetical protein